MQALILVDIQKDFLPGGALAVREGDLVVPVANGLIASGQFGLIIATRDFHPADHGSFASVHPGCRVGEKIRLGGVPQTLWPDHCVQGSKGAEFADGLSTEQIGHVIDLGTDRLVDGYSGFFDNAHTHDTGLRELLQKKQVDSVWIMGLATDYCVLYTALDAIAQGFKTHVIVEGCRGLDLAVGDTRRALNQMAARGVVLE